MMFRSTLQIAKDLPYRRDSEFFSAFRPMWSNCTSQILKLETRQEYDETGNPSYDAMRKGDWAESINLISKAHEDEVELYASLAEKGVDFIRCRPVVFPPSSYIKWEFEHYKYNETLGERIFIANYVAVDHLFQKYACNDLLIFDARLAAIYDHDTSGKLLGGWITEDIEDIADLQKLFIFIKANSHSFGKIVG